MKNANRPEISSFAVAVWEFLLAMAPAIFGFLAIAAAVLISR